MFNEIKDGIIKINKQQDTKMVSFEGEPFRTYRNKKIQWLKQELIGGS